MSWFSNVLHGWLSLLLVWWVIWVSLMEPHDQHKSLKSPCHATWSKFLAQCTFWHKCMICYAQISVILPPCFCVLSIQVVFVYQKKKISVMLETLDLSLSVCCLCMCLFENKSGHWLSYYECLLSCLLYSVASQALEIQFWRLLYLYHFLWIVENQCYLSPILQILIWDLWVMYVCILHALLLRRFL